MTASSASWHRANTHRSHKIRHHQLHATSCRRHHRWTHVLGRHGQRHGIHASFAFRLRETLAVSHLPLSYSKVAVLHTDRGHQMMRRCCVKQLQRQTVRCNVVVAASRPRRSLCASYRAAKHPPVTPAPDESHPCACGRVCVVVHGSFDACAASEFADE